MKFINSPAYSLRRTQISKAEAIMAKISRGMKHVIILQDENKRVQILSFLVSLSDPPFVKREIEVFTSRKV